MRIGEAASRLGVTTHLLRHWETVGVVAPRRTASGSRRYDQKLIDALIIAIKCQAAGMSLEAIARLLNGDRYERIELVSEQRDAIRHQQYRLTQTGAFLDHVLECSHSIVRECPKCHDFMASSW